MADYGHVFIYTIIISGDDCTGVYAEGRSQKLPLIEKATVSCHYYKNVEHN